MTLILTSGNTDQVTLVADRRFTYWDGSVRDEKNKMITFVCLNATTVFAFAGLAEAHKFKTHDWLWQSLSVAAEPGYLLGNSIARLANIATQQWTQLGDVLPERRRISIVAVGYVYSEAGPLVQCFKITNFERKDGTIEKEAQPAFKVLYRGQAKPGEFNFAITVGARQALKKGQLGALAELAQKHPPANALVDKSVSIIRETAKASSSVGDQCNSVILYADPQRPSVAEYHTSGLSNEPWLCVSNEKYAFGNKLHTSRVRLPLSILRRSSTRLPPTARYPGR